MQMCFDAAAATKSLQSCLTLCDPIEGSLQGSPVPGILQARTLEWVAISFSSAWKWKVKVKTLSHVQLLATPWTTAYQAPPPMGFSRQEYWSGVPLPSLVNHVDPPHNCRSFPFNRWELNFLLRLSSSLWLSLNDPKRKLKSMASLRAGIFNWPGERIPSRIIINR